MDVTAASDRWLLNRNKDLGLRLYVETDDGKTPVSSEPSPGGSSEEAAGGRRSWSPSHGPGGLAFSTCDAGAYLHPSAGLSGQRVRFPQCGTAGDPLPAESPSSPSAGPTVVLLRVSPCFPSPRNGRFFLLYRAAFCTRSFRPGLGEGKRSHPQALRQRPGCESRLCSLLTRWPWQVTYLSKPRFPHL